MDFRDIIAEHEAELVRKSCQAEGLDAALTAKVMDWHARHPGRLEYAEHHRDGVGHYVRCLAELLARLGGTAATPQPGSWLNADLDRPEGEPAGSPEERHS